MEFRKVDECPHVYSLIHLGTVCKAFIDRNKIDTPEAAFEVTYNSAEAYDLVKAICSVMGYYKPEE